MSDLPPKGGPMPSRPAEAPPEYIQARVEFANRFLAGRGLEIGALNWPLEVPPHAQVSHVDRMTVADLRREYPEMAEVELREVDIVDDGETLATIPDESQDFIVANHFLEHTGDPIGTIENHLAKLKPGGVLFYAVPDKRYTFDYRRPLTTLEHMVLDHEEGPERSRREHFDEWSLLSVGSETHRADPDSIPEYEAAALREARDLEAKDFSIHTHVWTQASFLELILLCRERCGEGFDVEAAARRANEFIVVLRKRGAWPEPPVAPAALETRIGELERRSAALEEENQRLGTALRATRGSLSWRLTKPFRSVKELLRGSGSPRP